MKILQRGLTKMDKHYFENFDSDLIVGVTFHFLLRMHQIKMWKISERLEETSRQSVIGHVHFIVSKY